MRGKVCCIAKLTSLEANNIRISSDLIQVRNGVINFRKRPASRSSFFLVSSCCQTRSTRQLFFRKVRFTSLSRAEVFSSFLRQNERFVVGWAPCFGQLCQKQPSTNTARRCFGNTKSGFPNILSWRRQPVMWNFRKTLVRAPSVALFPRPCTLDMISDRFDLLNTSAIILEVCR